ncbi:hypothetical protein AMS68_000891 [Peltaster fructicola]|uniref:GRIP domain-containing protein n=1 Tax=Peltaster fructicola TaxID=286661 RepID=A0A6H0XKW3_9PEZI|nr:hypothetical protein AMS68_000891 [Peltaster fructicola]
MFQRLKSLNLESFLDPKIAEEQAKHNAANSGRSSTSAARSPSARRNAGPARNGSPGPRSTQSKVADPLSVSAGKEPDPEDFVIGEDGSDMSRTATPRPVKELADTPATERDAEKQPKEDKLPSNEKSPTKSSDDVLPEDIRKKLAKLEMLTQKYQDLLRNYRTAHARVALIEPFESTLREHTSLTGIAEPGALVEFLDQRSKQNDMVMQELKRVTGEHRQVVGERDNLKKELDEAEKKAKDAFDEAAGLRSQKGESESATTVTQGEGNISEIEALKASQKEELQRQVEYINELATENAQFRSDLSTCRLDLDASRLNLIRREKDNDSLQAELNTAKSELDVATKAQLEHEENLKNGKYAQREEQRLKTYEEVISKLRTQVKEAEDDRKSATNKVNDLEFEIKRLEAEVSSSASIISRLRPMEERSVVLTKQLADAEKERDDAQRLADTKRGHEAAVASLRSQLKRAIGERDAAYQMILDCGKCKVPEPTEETAETETNDSRSRGTSDPKEDAEVSAQPAGDDTTEGKKKKKKKSKAKAKAASAEKEVSNEQSNNNHTGFIANAIEELQRQRIDEEHEADTMRLHFEGVVEEQRQKLKDLELVIRDREDEIERLKGEITRKENAIDKLQTTVQEHEGLQEEVETLRESLQDIGGQVTGAKQEAAEAREARAKLQAQVESAQAETVKAEKQLRETKVECARLTDKCSQLESDAVETKTADGNSSAELDATKTELASLVEEHKALQATKDAHESDLEQLRKQQSSDNADHESKHKSLTADFERMKSRTTTLETDLNAANLLAQNRYKEVTDIKQHFSKVQPELKRLREEATELKTQKAELEKANATVRKLEAKDRDLKAEIAEYKNQAARRDAETADLKDKVKKARERSTALEDTYERSRKDIEEHQRIRDEALDAKDKLQQQADKSQQERRALKTRVDELEKQVKKATDESRGLRDEVQLKSAKHASAQSQMDSLENQSRELATQMKEVQSRCDGLEEELADSQRLLSERSREAETMRRLLADVEGRADGRVKEMRERLDLATEERDRAEDEASSLGRKKAREVEDYKNRLRDLERDVTRANEAKTDAERREQDIRTRQEDLERRFTLTQNEVTEVRTAMSQLRDALDEGERQARELEKQKVDLRKTLEEREARLERLQKSSKAMAEELRTLQTTSKRQASVQSSRSSMERVTSPGPRSPAISTPSTTIGKTDQAVDYVYLKNILLQFLEQKEKRHQMQLIPVLGMLLHFDKSEEAKWMSVVSAK